MEMLSTLQLQYPCETYLLNSDDCRGLKGNESDASHRLDIIPPPPERGRGNSHQTPGLGD